MRMVASMFIWSRQIAPLCYGVRNRQRIAQDSTYEVSLTGAHQQLSLLTDIGAFWGNGPRSD